MYVHVCALGRSAQSAWGDTLLTESERVSGRRISAVALAFAPVSQVSRGWGQGGYGRDLVDRAWHTKCVSPSSLLSLPTLNRGRWGRNCPQCLQGSSQWGLPNLVELCLIRGRDGAQCTRLPSRLALSVRRSVGATCLRSTGGMQSRHRLKRGSSVRTSAARLRLPWHEFCIAHPHRKHTADLRVAWAAP